MHSLELCAGAGGQALGLEQGGFEHAGLVEIDKEACRTLRANRPTWPVFEADLREFDGRPYKGIDLLAGGLPCPPFSKAGRQLGEQDERNLFPVAIRLTDEVRPQAVMIENVRGILDPQFEDYRNQIVDGIEALGYRAQWKLLNASDFGVSQLRPRVVFVALRNSLYESFSWPDPAPSPPKTVGQLLCDLMAANGWNGAEEWAERANDIAPTVVGGSKKHGGPDLGPTRAKRAWAALGVNGHLIAKQAPEAGFVGDPYLTVRMVARLQGFPDDWDFVGAKTSAYRQVGNAFPPPVARAVSAKLHQALSSRASHAVLK